MDLSDLPHGPPNFVTALHFLSEPSLIPPRIPIRLWCSFNSLLSMILFLSREGVRNALLRVKSHEDADPTLRRLSTLQDKKSNNNHIYKLLAAMTELLSEPMYNLFVSVYSNFPALIVKCALEP
jgi:hypothetical protein